MVNSLGMAINGPLENTLFSQVGRKGVAARGAPEAIGIGILVLRKDLQLLLGFAI